MDLVDEEYDLSVALRHFVDDRLQTLLKFALVFRSGHESSHVEREYLLGAEVFRYVAAHYPLGQALGYGGLAGARLAYEHGVVFGASAEYLEHAADLVVAAYHRIELALTGALIEVDGILVEGVVGLLCALVGGFLAFAQLVDRGFELLVGQSGILEDA